MDDFVRTHWIEATRSIEEKIGKDSMVYFGLDRVDQDVSEVLGGLNARTFSTLDPIWRDEENSFFWFKQGLYVFDFRAPGGDKPVGKATLVKSRHPLIRIILFCEVVHSHVNTQKEVPRAIALGQIRPVYSKSCGRAVLDILDFIVEDLRVTPHIKVYEHISDTSHVSIFDERGNTRRKKKKNLLA